MISRCFPLPALLLALLLSRPALADLKILPPDGNLRYHCASVDLWPPYGLSEFQRQWSRYSGMADSSLNLVRLPVDWSGGIGAGLPGGVLNYLAGIDLVPLLMLQPQLPESERTGGQTSLDLLLSRRYDKQIERFFRRLGNLQTPAGAPFPVMIAPAPFAAADDQSGWSLRANGATAGEKFKRAWRHVHNLAALSGAGNITWVFGARQPDSPDEATTLATHYPGDRYVDWVGVGAYGPVYGPEWDYYSSFSADNFGPRGGIDSIFEQVRRIAPDKPRLILDIYAAEKPGEAYAKAILLGEFFSLFRTSLNDFSGFCYGNREAWVGYDNNRWIDSSPYALDSYNAGLRSNPGPASAKRRGHVSGTPEDGKDEGSSREILGIFSERHGYEGNLYLDQDYENTLVTRTKGLNGDQILCQSPREAVAAPRYFDLVFGGVDLPEWVGQATLHISWSGRVPPGELTIYDQDWKIVARGRTGSSAISLVFQGDGAKGLSALSISTDALTEEVGFSVTELYLSY